MVSVILYGRNDNYGFNLPKRTANGLNCMAEILDDENDEILFVDYNTPAHLPTLPEFIWDTLTERASHLLKVIRISAEIHKKIRGDSPLPVLENVSRNAAIVRSNPANHWMLSTNPDVILALASRWSSFNDFLKHRPDSFYEMPRFDVPESVWALTSRTNPKQTRELLRDWVASNGAAVAETMPDPRFQKYLLFDAPGDFQLAPREFFFRLRGFDESMNKYLHSDSNLAKRMWLLNGGRTDHLLGDLWVVHQDHYLSGEWARNVASIAPNDHIEKVLNEEKIEANDAGWGLQQLELPTFSLAERMDGRRIRENNGAAIPQNDGLPLSKEIDWTTQPFYRLCRYHPEVLTLYLREVLGLVKPDSTIVYLGEHRSTFASISKAWHQLHSNAAPVRNLAESAGEVVAPDVLLVDFFHERGAAEENRIRLEADGLQRKVNNGALTSETAALQLACFCNDFDSRQQYNRLLSLWRRCFPSLRILPGTYVVLLGCNTAIGIFDEFRKLVEQSCTGQSPNNFRSAYSLLRGLLSMRQKRDLPYFHHLTPDTSRRLQPLVLHNLYMHHRLLITVVEPQSQN